MEKSIFATRLKEIMKTKDKLETHNGKTKIIKKYTQTDLANVLGYSVDTVKSWTKSNGTLPTLETVKTIAELFDVDTAYLLGEQECKRHEDQTICDVTLLDEQSANILTNLSEFESEALNSLIKHSDFKLWLYSLYDFTHSHNIRATTHNAAIMLDREKVENHSYTKNALKYQTSDLLGKILDDIYRENEQIAHSQLAMKEFEELMLLIEDVMDGYINNEEDYEHLLSQIKKTIDAINKIADGKIKLYQYPPEFYINNRDIIIKQLRI